MALSYTRLARSSDSGTSSSDSLANRPLSESVSTVGRFPGLYASLRRLSLRRELSQQRRRLPRHLSRLLPRLQVMRMSYSLPPLLRRLLTHVNCCSTTALMPENFSIRRASVMMLCRDGRSRFTEHVVGTGSSLPQQGAERSPCRAASVQDSLRSYRRPK